MDNNKLNFIFKESFKSFRRLTGNEKALWGVMNPQQMIEHLIDAVMAASGKVILPQVLKGEQMEKMRAFMLSDKPFRENTDNPLMPKVPANPKHKSISAAVDKLENEVNYFISAFNSANVKTTVNPFFGELNYAESVHLLDKHFKHHLRQFNML